MKRKSSIAQSVFLACVMIGSIILPISAFSTAVSAYTTHAPVSINGDTDFASQANTEGWDGNGSSGNPYVITLLEISTNQADGIKIQSTTCYFKIINCYVHCSNNPHGNIYLNGVQNGRIEDSTLSNGDCGIYIDGESSDIEIIDNVCQNNNDYGILLSYSTDCTLDENELTNDGIFIQGSDESDFNSYAIDDSNTVNGNPVYYRANQEGTSIPTDAGQVIMASCSDTEISGLTISHADVGIEIAYCYGIKISDSTFSDNHYGIYILESDDNEITSNICSNNHYGIYLSSSDSNKITDNICEDDVITGIFAVSSDSNEMSGNILSGSTQFGIDYRKQQYEITYDLVYDFYLEGGLYKVDHDGITRSESNARVLIQTMIDELSTTESAVFNFDQGTYVIDSSGICSQVNGFTTWYIGLDVDKRISIQCNGAVFQADSGITSTHFIVMYPHNVNPDSHYADYIEIKGAVIDCNQYGYVTKNIHGIIAHNEDYLLIENCEIKNFGGYGIDIDSGSDYPTIRYNYVHEGRTGEGTFSSYSHGIALHNNGQEGLVLGNVLGIVGIDRYAIMINEMEGARVIDNTIYFSYGPGIVVNDGATDALVMGNAIYRDNFVGYSYDHSTFRSICVWGTYRYGVYKWVSDVQIIGNEIHGDTNRVSRFGSIDVNDLCRHTIVRDNQMLNAIVVDSAADTFVSCNDGFEMTKGAEHFIRDSSTFSTNTVFGALLKSSSCANILYNNEFASNIVYGLNIIDDTSNQNSAYENSFQQNNGAGNTPDSWRIQAYDDGDVNSWFNTEGYGNYWSDLTSPDIVAPYGIIDSGNEYVIAGSAGSEDCHPQIKLNLHAPISINNNFATVAATEGWAGDGSSGNPYIIRDYLIDASSGTGISIMNTNCYFSIRHVEIISTSHSYKGIYFNSVTNAKIENVDITDCQYGIYIVSSCSDIEINGGSISSCSNSGAYIDCDNLSINGLASSSNTNYGIWIAYSVTIEITNVDISNNDYHGIYLSSSSGATVSGSEIVDNSYSGIYLASCSNPEIENNLLSLNVQNGLYLSSCSGAQILGNEISNNGPGYSGILAYGGDGLIHGNTISNNNYYGVKLSGCTGMDVYHNNFCSNYVQAYGNNAAQNDWDDGSLGNYWSDYQTPYAFNYDQDNYPTTTMFT